MVNRKTRRLNRKVSRRTRKVRRSRKVSRKTRKVSRRSQQQRGGNLNLLLAAAVAVVVADAVVNSQSYTDIKAKRVLKNYKHDPANMRSATL